ncbi:unnamed protein product, partial [marine sediment metagenome]
ISAQGLKKVRDIVSSYFDMGHTKFGELESVFEEEDIYPGIAEKVADGTWSVHRGYTKIRDTIKKQKDVVLIESEVSRSPYLDAVASSPPVNSRKHIYYYLTSITHTVFFPILCSPLQYPPRVSA